ncbi:MAG TPA: hypothetical protein VF026_26130 [Ktedonobacteraceae bacterium]
MVVVRAEKCCQLPQNVRVPAREDHTGVMPPCGHLACDGRAAYGRPGDLLPQVRGHPFGQHLGQDAQIAVLGRLHPLCNGEHHHARLQERGQLLARPAHPEGVDPAQSDLGALESLSGLLELICADRLGDLAIEAGMHAGLLYAVDDVAVEVSTHQPYVVAVVSQREAECRGHDARPQNAYSRHCFSSQKSEQSQNEVVRLLNTYHFDPIGKSGADARWTMAAPPLPRCFIVSPFFSFK